MTSDKYKNSVLMETEKPNKRTIISFWKFSEFFGALAFF